MYHLIRATGHAEGWSVAFYFFTFIRGILFFTVIVLIGTGWSYLKVCLCP
jgi:G protein-coupled receptor 107